MHLKVFGAITLVLQQVTINGWKWLSDPCFWNHSQKKNLTMTPLSTFKVQTAREKKCMLVQQDWMRHPTFIINWMTNCNWILNHILNQLNQSTQRKIGDKEKSRQQTQQKIYNNEATTYAIDVFFWCDNFLFENNKYLCVQQFIVETIVAQVI